MPTYDYGCLMAPIPEPMASRLRGYGMAIPEERLYLDEETHGREGEPHVTVLYGIEGDYQGRLSNFAESGLIGAVLGNLSVFDNEDSIVLKVEVQSDGLSNLNALAKSVFEHTSGYRDYNPHITIAYLKHDSFDPEYEYPHL